MCAKKIIPVKTLFDSDTDTADTVNGFTPSPIINITQSSTGKSCMVVIKPDINKTYIYICPVCAAPLKWYAKASISICHTCTCSNGDGFYIDYTNKIAVVSPRKD